MHGWYVPVILALVEGGGFWVNIQPGLQDEFEASVSNIVRPCLKKKNNKTTSLTQPKSKQKGKRKTKSSHSVLVNPVFKMLEKLDKSQKRFENDQEAQEKTPSIINHFILVLFYCKLKPQWEKVI